MKILQVIPYFYPAHAFGGSMNAAYQISRELARRKNEVVVYTTDAKDFCTRLRTNFDREIDGMRVFYFRNISMMPVRKSMLFITPQLVSHAKAEVGKFDIIHFHEYTTFQNPVVAHYARMYHVPYVLQVHGSLSGGAGKRTLKKLYNIFAGNALLRDASRVIALSPIEALQYRRAAVPLEKIVVVPNGISLREYADLPKKGTFKKRIGMDKGNRTILFIGRINRFKGIEFLIHGFARLLRQKIYDDVRLIVAGPDDGYLQEIVRLAKRLSLESRILFMGPLYGIEKIEAYVDASVVASLDSLREIVFLLVPLEAAACGTPVLVTESNYVAELARKGRFGFSVEYGNVRKLADLLGRMLSSDELLRELGLNGRKFIFENFDWGDKVDKIEDVYEQSIQERQ